MSAESVRLNKYLAEHLGLSRREVDDLIAAGKVIQNDRPAVLGERLLPGAKLLVNGQIIDTISAHVYTYILLNKPAGYVCSRHKQGDTPTVYELLPPNLRALKTVGRLDKDSSGLILLTDDGDFAYQMTHPRFAKVKIYEVTLDRPLEPLHQQMISDFGVTLADGTSQFVIEKANMPGQYLATLREGRNRQIRRTFAALGYDVVGLHRTVFGPYQLDDLAAGKYRPVKGSAG